MDAPINSDAVLDAVRELFDSGTWWIYKGKTVRQFEDRFSRAHDSRYGVTTCNGTVPLEIVLRALGIGTGDKVILPAYDFYSLPKSVSNTGAIPLFVDVGNLNPTISSSQIAESITPDVKAVVVAHISGAVAEIDMIADICEKAGVHLIEDCAQSAGSIYGNRRVGSRGIAGTFSFGGIKLMTCGQGGMIVTSEDVLYEKCYAMVNRGVGPEGSINKFKIVGDNFQMSELSAVTLGPQLDMLEHLCQERETIMALLDEGISRIDGLTPVKQFQKTTVRAQMRYSFYCSLLKIDPDSLISCADRLNIRLFRGHKCVTSDERLHKKYSSGETYPNALKAEKELICIHHTDILKGKGYWQEALKELKDNLPTNRSTEPAGAGQST